MLKKGIFLGFCSLLFMVVKAQISESDTAKWQSKTSISANWQTGNVEYWALRAKWEMCYRPTPAWAFKTQNAYLYQEFFKIKADEDLSTRNFIYWKPDARVYPFLMFFASSNYRREINQRFLAGAGATYRFFRHGKVALSLAYEETIFSQNTYNEPQYNNSFQINTWRATLWLYAKHALKGGKIVLHYEAFAQPSVEQTNNFRAQAEAGIDFFLSKQLSFITNFIYTYESIVTERDKTQDTILTVGFSHHFKK